MYVVECSSKVANVLQVCGTYVVGSRAELPIGLCYEHRFSNCFTFATEWLGAPMSGRSLQHVQQCIEQQTKHLQLNALISRLGASQLQKAVDQSHAQASGRNLDSRLACYS